MVVCCAALAGLSVSPFMVGLVPLVVADVDVPLADEEPRRLCEAVLLPGAVSCLLCRPIGPAS